MMKSSYFVNGSVSLIRTGYHERPRCSVVNQTNHPDIQVAAAGALIMALGRLTTELALGAA